MNDSFLEDLELVSTEARPINSYPVDRHVTMRTATSTPLQAVSQNKAELHVEKAAKDPKKLMSEDFKKQQIRVRTSERKEKHVETKLKPIENKVVKNEVKEQDIKEEIKAKLRESRVKSSESKVALKDKARRSGSYKENAVVPDASSKENSRPSEGSKEGASQVEVAKDKTKVYDKKATIESKETDPVALLNAIKDIVSMHTKQESTKILRAMQELHFNSQANLIKHLLSQTDDIIHEMHPSKDSNRVKSLIEQNERLQEDMVILQRRNEELQKKLEEMEFLKQENIALKMKCKELAKQ